MIQVYIIFTDMPVVNKQAASITRVLLIYRHSKMQHFRIIDNFHDRKLRSKRIRTKMNAFALCIQK